MTLRWLGVAGLDLGCSGRRIVFDPYFTRISMRDMLFSRLHSNASLIRRYLPTCDAILITHSHFDHLMDAAEAARQTGATIHGSPNTCRILRAEGLPERQIKELIPGCVVEQAGVRITALAERRHQWVGGFGMQPLDRDIKPPLRARDYAMDFGFSFHVECAGVRMLTEECLEPGVVGRVDILFTSPLHPLAANAEYLNKLVNTYHPRVLIPIHCDDMFSPLSAPMRGQLAPTGRVLPPLARFDGNRYKRLVETLPDAPSVFLPVRLREYTLNDILAQE